MKKAIYTILIFSIFIFSFTACAASDTGSSETLKLVEDTEEIAAENPTEEIIAEEPTQKPTDEPAPEPDDSMIILEQYLVNPTIVFSEDASMMAENDGGQFGFVEIKNYNADEDLFEFTSGDDGAYVKLNTLLDEIGDNQGKGSSQGILFKFQPPEDVYSFYFNFYGPNDSEFGVEFREEGKPSLFIFMEAIKEPFDGDFVLETGKTYSLLLALSSDGKVTSSIWEVGNTDNYASYTANFADRQGGENYQNSSRSFSIGFASHNTLKIAEFSVLTFDDINQ